MSRKLLQHVRSAGNPGVRTSRGGHRITVAGRAAANWSSLQYLPGVSFVPREPVNPSRGDDGVGCFDDVHDVDLAVSREVTQQLDELIAVAQDPGPISLLLTPFILSLPELRLERAVP